MTVIYTQRKIVPIADHDPAKFPKRLFAQNEDGTFDEVDKKIFFRVERYIPSYQTSVPFGTHRIMSASIDNRPLFVEVE